MRPPRACSRAQPKAPGSCTIAVPRSPPHSTVSPTCLPGTGKIRTAVVLWFIIPMASSSAMMPNRTSGGVSPGTATMSRPTEHTELIASSLARLSAPSFTASIMPWSSDTGMKAPERPPTLDEAIAPPFFTASVRSASAAVDPQPPARSTPIASRMSPTESPAAGVGARLRSRIPKLVPSRRAASRPTSSPIRATLKAVRLIVSAQATRSASGPRRCNAERTTPGPETPTFKTVSGSPAAMCAPATKGLSGTALQKQTSLAHARPPRSAVRPAASSTTSTKRATASMLMPERVAARETDAQTCSVSARAFGIEPRRASSAVVKPLST